MTEYIELGPVPYDEECAQVGSANYTERALAECKRYRDQLLKQWPNARIGIKAFAHDFGSYHEVVVRYDPNNEEEVSLAFEIENNLPSNWE